MPRDLKRQLDGLLSEGSMHTSLQLRKWLGDNGFEISRRCIDDYRHNFERRLDSVRLASEQARIVCDQFKGDDAQMQSALMRLVQTRLFEVLVVANEKETSSKKRTSPTVAAVNVGALARCVSGLVKAETEHRKWIEHTRAAVNAAEKKVDDAQTKGLSQEAAAPNQSRPDGNLENGNGVRTAVCTAAEGRILSRARKESRARQGPSPSILSLTGRGEKQNKATAV